MNVQECVVYGCKCWYTIPSHQLTTTPCFMYSSWQFHVFLQSDIRSSSIIFACSNVLIAAFKIVMLFGSVSISNLWGKKINSEMNAWITFTYVFVFHLSASKRPPWTRGLKCELNKFSYCVIYWLLLSYIDTDYVLLFTVVHKREV
jgi:hypothetical protein